MAWVILGNCLCLPGWVVASSRRTASCTGLCAPSRSIHTASTSCVHDSLKELSQNFQSGMTCAPLMENPGEDLWIWFQEDSLVRTSHVPGLDVDSRATVQVFGTQWRESLKKCSHDMSSLKIAQDLSAKDSTSSFPTLPRWGMMQDGRLSELIPWEPLTSEKDSGLEDLWPTPTVCGNYNRKGLSKTSGDGLATAVYRFEPEGHPPLNPDWVDWLMGFPVGWSSVQKSEALCRKWHKNIRDIPRVSKVCPDRAARLKALGNAQVPLQATVAWSLLSWFELGFRDPDFWDAVDAAYVIEYEDRGSE